MEEIRNEHEYQWSTHLIVLFTHTIFCLVLVVEIALLGWELWMIPLILLEIALCWSLHLSQTFSPGARLRIYAVLEMVTFFFYGIHETSFSDMSLVILVLIMVYTMTSEMEIIYAGAATYYITLIYCLLFGSREQFIPDALHVTRLLLHVGIVWLVCIIAKTMIARRKSTRDEFMQRITDLEETNERTEDFLTNVSHELRTPINAVTGISAVMLRGEKEPRRIKDLSAIQDAGHRLFEQIDDILDHTEISTGRLKLNEDNYMLSSVVSDLRSEIYPTYKLGSVGLIFDISPDIPKVLSGDVRKLKKICRHLIENAIKFTRQGAVYVKFSSISRDYGINLIIDVRDTGIGIEEDEIDRITEQFYQSDRGRNRRAGGLGLGLSIVAGLCSAMEGFIQIKSKKEQGTSVRVSIPQSVTDDAKCISFREPEKLGVVFYDRPETYIISEVWDYYSSLIASLSEGTHVTVHRITRLREIEKLSEHTRLTHLFLGWAEYEEERQYVEALTSKLLVIVSADEGFDPLPGSGVRVLRMPVTSFTIASMLTAKHVSEDRAKERLSRRMICPGVRALVVDDDVMNLVVARGIFKEYQLEVETASSGAQSIKMCKEHRYDLIFMDHMMPEMDGVEVMKRLRRMDYGRKAKIIALTANAVSGAREMFFEEGFDEFLAKPLEDAELERVLKKLLPPSKVRYKITEEEEGHTDKDIIPSELGTMGLDVDAGLKYCADDPKFYLDILTKFSEQAKNIAQELNEYEQSQREEETDCVPALCVMLRGTVTSKRQFPY